MKNGLQINWNKLNEHSKNTLKNSEDFENARNEFKKIIESLDECWKGKDANSYKATSLAFLDDLKKDTMYFESLGKYFDIGGRVYSSVIEEHAKKIENLNQKLEEDRTGGVR